MNFYFIDKLMMRKKAFWHSSHDMIKINEIMLFYFVNGKNIIFNEFFFSSFIAEYELNIM